MRTLSTHSKSIIFGLLGVIGFSLTLPATRMAVVELDPTFVGLGRAIIAAAIAGLALAVTRSRKPAGKHLIESPVLFISKKSPDKTPNIIKN